MDRSKFCQAAFKSNKTAEANAFRLCFEIRSFVKDPGNSETRKSFLKYADRLLQILKREHKLSKSEDFKEKIAGAFKQDSILIFTLTNITVFSLDDCQDLFMIFLLSIERTLEKHIIDNIDTISTLLVTPVSSLDLDLMCGQFFRDLIQNSNLCQAFLKVKVFDQLVKLAGSEVFELSSDACTSLRALLDNSDASAFINSHPIHILKGLYRLCDSGYYVKRMSLSLIYSILKSNNNKQFAEFFVGNQENLKYAMNLMKEDESVEVKIDGFFLFAQITMIVFAQTSRSEMLSYRIIRKNKERIVKYLEKFQNYRDDGNFQTEKRKILEILSAVD
ncbi:hypothetical protein SteCoe_19085 [Stentor coeruleus]|uniref:Uncharacterized protein n=1 Tax=Stentor coeruleus TaxID=5963 RepID=A0A1R2BV82_9CILI|nr:hypothetical protein SteCoe_19085 [Stentor coeruleus]